MIKLVTDTITKKQFLDVPRVLYKGDPYWVCPLDSQIEAVFEAKKNHLIKGDNVRRWIAFDDAAHLAGRIAAFVHPEKATKYEVPTGGIGFFECVNDQEMANRLFTVAIEWLREKGMKALEGPINLGENDSFWGLLVEGFTAPSLGMNYNMPYYQPLFENFGFEKGYDQITNHLSARIPFPERFTKIAGRVMARKEVTFEPLRIANYKKYAADLKNIYNDAWKDFPNFTPLTNEAMEETFKKMKPIMDENLIWFAYVNQEPASFLVVVPDANPWLKPLDGKMGVIEKIRFLYYRNFKKATRMRAIVMGTKPAYQRHGLESALFIKIKEYVLPLNQYEEMELSWVGDFNEKMISIHNATGASFGKRHRTYRYHLPA